MRHECWSGELLVLFLTALMASGCGDARTASSSMVPTIQPGEKVTINYGAYAVDGPKRWEVVAFEPPEAPDAMWVFRVVGMPGESVSFDKGGMTLNGRALQLPDWMSNVTYVSFDHTAFANVQSSITFPYTVPKEHYFVLGDNSTNANDSRFWGGVPRSNILGRAKGK